jgi:hypothetical protein
MIIFNRNSMGKAVPVLNQSSHKDIGESGCIDPRILDLDTSSK